MCQPESPVSVIRPAESARRATPRAGLLNLAVAAPARIGVAAVERVHGEAHGVAAAVVAPALEVVGQTPLTRLPGLPIDN